MDRVPVDRMFRAFSDPTRLRILHLLAAGELCVGDIVSVLKVPPPTASRHFGYFRGAGLISPRKKSYWTFFRGRSRFHEIEDHSFGAATKRNVFKRRTRHARRAVPRDEEGVVAARSTRGKSVGGGAPFPL